MRKAHNAEIFTLVASSLLFTLVYFGFDTKPRSHKDLEQSRVLMLEVTGVENLLNEAKASLPNDSLALIVQLEQTIEMADSAQSVKSFEALSSVWFALGHYGISGHYAEQIAIYMASDEAWSIAGTTYFKGVSENAVEKVRDFCFVQAVKSFENAISLNPSEPGHQLNLALCYVERPPEENPMRGIQMLLDLNERFPQTQSILLNLARLSIRTGQYEKARERLEEVLELDPNHLGAICAIGDVYKSMGNQERANYFNEICINSTLK